MSFIKKLFLVSTIFLHVCGCGGHEGWIEVLTGADMSIILVIPLDQHYCPLCVCVAVEDGWIYIEKGKFIKPQTTTKVWREQLLITSPACDSPCFKPQQFLCSEHLPKDKCVFQGPSKFHQYRHLCNYRSQVHHMTHHTPGHNNSHSKVLIRFTRQTKIYYQDKQCELEK